VCQFSTQLVKSQADGRTICQQWADVRVTSLRNAAGISNYYCDVNDDCTLNVAKCGDV